MLKKKTRAIIVRSTNESAKLCPNVPQDTKMAVSLIFSPDEVGAEAHEKARQKNGANAENEILFGAVRFLFRLDQDRIFLQVTPELVQHIREFVHD